MENSEMLHHLLDIFTYPTQIYDFFVKVIAKGVCFSSFLLTFAEQINGYYDGMTFIRIVCQSPVPTGIVAF